MSRARQIIEAAIDPRKLIKDLPRMGVVPHPMTPDEQERAADLIASGPLSPSPLDKNLWRWGYVQPYDDTDDVEVTPAFAAAFYDRSGGVRPEFRDAPTGWRGRIRTY